MLSKKKQLDVEKLDLDNAKECGAYLVIPFKKGIRATPRGDNDTDRTQLDTSFDEADTNYEVTHVNSYSIAKPGADFPGETPCILLDVDLLKDSKDYTQMRARHKLSFDEKLCDTIEIPYRSCQDLSQEEQRQIMALDAYASLPDLAKADYPWVTGCDFRRPSGEPRCSLGTNEDLKSADATYASADTKRSTQSLNNLPYESKANSKSSKSVTITEPSPRNGCDKQEVYGTMDAKTKQTLEQLYALPAQKNPHKSILKKSISLGSLSPRSPPHSARKSPGGTLYPSQSLPRLREERTTPPPLPKRDIVTTPLSPKSGIPYKQIGPGNKLILRENYYNTKYDQLLCRVGANVKRRPPPSDYYSSVDLPARVMGVQQRIREGAVSQSVGITQGAVFDSHHKPIIGKPERVAESSHKKQTNDTTSHHHARDSSHLHYSHHDRPRQSTSSVGSSPAELSPKVLHYSHHDRPSRDRPAHTPSSITDNPPRHSLHYSHHDRPSKSSKSQASSSSPEITPRGASRYPLSDRSEELNTILSVNPPHCKVLPRNPDRPPHQPPPEDLTPRSPVVNPVSDLAPRKSLHHSHHEKPTIPPIAKGTSVKNSYCKHVAFAGLPATSDSAEDDEEESSPCSGGDSTSQSGEPPPLERHSRPRCTCKKKHNPKSPVKSANLFIPQPNKACVKHDKATYCDQKIQYGNTEPDRLIYSELYKATVPSHTKKMEFVDKAPAADRSPPAPPPAPAQAKQEGRAVDGASAPPPNSNSLDAVKSEAKKGKGILRNKPLSPRRKTPKQLASRLISDPLPRNRKSFTTFDREKQGSYFKRTLSVPVEVKPSDRKVAGATSAVSVAGGKKKSLLDDLIRKNHDRQLLLI